MSESPDAPLDPDDEQPGRRPSSRGPLVPILVAVTVALILTVAALWAATRGGDSVPIPQGTVGVEQSGASGISGPPAESAAPGPGVLGRGAPRGCAQPSWTSRRSSDHSVWKVPSRSTRL